MKAIAIGLAAGVGTLYLVQWLPWSGVLRGVDRAQTDGRSFSYLQVDSPAAWFSTNVPQVPTAVAVGLGAYLLAR